MAGDESRLTAVLGALAAVGATLTTLFADEAAAEDCQAGLEAAAATAGALLLGRGTLLVAHLLLRRRQHIRLLFAAKRHGLDIARLESR